MNPIARATAALAALGAAASLAGCGGHSDAAQAADTATSSREVPASALASPVAFTEFVGSLPASDTQEPLDVATLMPPTSETGEPAPVN